jgi:hypothetical protein
MLMIMRMVIIAACAALAGCQTTGTGSVKGGECRVFERPEYAVRGKRPYDQDWVDSQIEGGVGACGWKRPAPRPASLDAAQAPKNVAPAPPKHRGIVKRITDRVTSWPAAKPAPVVATPQSPEPVTVVPPEPMRDPVDDLLTPEK